MTPDPRRRRLLGIALALTSAASFGVMPVLTKVVYDDGAEPIGVLAVRFALAAAVLLGLAAARRERLPRGRTLATLLALGGIGYVGMSLCYFFALERISALTSADLSAALADPSPVVQRRACEAVAARPGDQPPSLAGALASDDATVAEVAAWASGERQPAEPGVVPRLAALATDHADALVREAAVAALGAIGDPLGLPAILAATADKATVRRRAVIALAPFEGEAVEAALSRAREDRDWQVRQAAEDLS